MGGRGNTGVTEDRWVMGLFGKDKKEATRNKSAFQLDECWDLLRGGGEPHDGENRLKEMLSIHTNHST